MLERMSLSIGLFLKEKRIKVFMGAERLQQRIVKERNAERRKY